MLILSVPFQVGLDRVTSQSYRDLLTRIAQQSLFKAYESINNRIKEVSFLHVSIALHSIYYVFFKLTLPLQSFSLYRW